MGLTYTPDRDIKIHDTGAIRLICADFQSHENGLPEWVKNSSDEYTRRGTNPEDRVIVVIFDQGARDRERAIGVLDFGGMNPETIEDNFGIGPIRKRPRVAPGALGLKGAMAMAANATWP